MKKFMKLITISVAFLVLVGCGSKDGEKKTFNVGVAIYKFDDNFMTEYRKELESYAKEKGDELGYNFVLDIQDGKGDQPNQTEQINNFIVQQKDVIIANLIDPTATSVIIDKARAADIPVVLINREPDPKDLNIWPGKTAYVGADATQSGTIQGEMIWDLPNHGDVNGDGVIKYITLLGDPGNVDSQQRTEYSIRGYEDKGGKTQALAEPYPTNWEANKGQELTASALTQFADDLEVIFSNADPMAEGAVIAINAAGRKVNEDIYVVGVNGSPDSVELLRQGQLTGTVLNDHFNQSHTALDVAILLLEGGESKPYYWHDYVRVQSPEDVELKKLDPKIETVEEVLERYSQR